MGAKCQGAKFSGVAENFGRLRSLFAQFWSTFAVVRSLNWLVRKLLVLLGIRTESEFKNNMQVVVAITWPHRSKNRYQTVGEKEGSSRGSELLSDFSELWRELCLGFLYGIESEMRYVEKQGVGRPPTRWTDDQVKAKLSRWMQAAANRSNWRSMGEAYVQHYFREYKTSAHEIMVQKHNKALFPPEMCEECVFYEPIGTSLRSAVSTRDAWAEAVAATQTGTGTPEQRARGASWPILLFFGVIAAAPYIVLRMLNGLTSSVNERLNDPTSWQNPLRAVAQHDFQATSPQEISFHANQCLQGQLWNSGWLMGSTDRQHAGLVPVNYIKVIKPVEEKDKEPSVEELNKYYGQELPLPKNATIVLRRLHHRTPAFTRSSVHLVEGYWGPNAIQEHIGPKTCRMGTLRPTPIRVTPPLKRRLQENRRKAVGCAAQRDVCRPHGTNKLEYAMTVKSLTDEVPNKTVVTAIAMQRDQCAGSSDYTRAKRTASLLAKCLNKLIAVLAVRFWHFAGRYRGTLASLARLKSPRVVTANRKTEALTPPTRWTITREDASGEFLFLVAF
ncbi:hypothetical protein MSG28_013705 [Choristoneura fumiferana]|uniref:Uncharacterized protein n=1 Tax=Choristoneura fumiferana TaxID=7141 RepID=A0ACC0K8B3_CHOFU|nr:hypothetical protein MSG28_013705 [Choristoneura fumiferana]